MLTKKRIIVVISIVMMLMLALTACTSKDESKSNDAGKTASKSGNSSVSGDTLKPSNVERPNVPHDSDVNNRPEDAEKSDETEKTEETEKPEEDSGKWQTTVKFDEDKEHKVDLNGDGKKEIVKLYTGEGNKAKLEIRDTKGKVLYEHKSDEGDDFNAVTVYIADFVKGDGKLAVAYSFDTCSSDLALKAVHVEKDGSITSIKFNAFGIKTDKLFANNFSVKKGKIELSYIIELFGTSNIYAQAKFDAKTNTITEVSKVYSFKFSPDAIFYECKTKKDLKATDSEGKETTIKAGAQLNPIETDNKTYVIVEILDKPGVQYKIELKVVDGYQYYLAGMPQDDLFDGLNYAG